VGVLAFDAQSIDVGAGPEPVDALQILAPSRAVSGLGLPALAIPAVLDDEGFPVGVQLVGGAGTERALVAAASAIAPTG
jgi:Asp-tRNA(Asn)/Glu-tRNA(Gln) amidotransferase A subunit family amidase